jgi:hydrogenase expression/formation protein HypC
MCLAVPGKIIERREDAYGMPTAKVSFGGVIKEISLVYVPEATIGEYVIVHVGFAISKLNEEEALQTFEYLRQMDELSESESPPPGKPND